MGTNCATELVITHQLVVLSIDFDRLTLYPLVELTRITLGYPDLKYQSMVDAKDAWSGCRVCLKIKF